jgi:hypothetical protein
MSQVKNFRFYAKRLAGSYTRRCQIGFRLNEVAKGMLQKLAAQRRMSVAEYVARLVCDHLGQIGKAMP